VPRGYKLAESRDKEKTIFDFVIDKTIEIKKSIIKFALFLIFLSVVFFAADAFFLQFTGPGRAIHNRIWPPGLIIESVPSGAAVEIETESGRNILPARSRTPVNLERINPGTYSLSMEHEGFNRVDKNITVTETSHDGSNILIPGSSREYTDSITQKFIIPFEITLHIDSNPREADVFINERKLGGVTPITLELPVDRYNIVIEKEDYVPLGARQIGETTGRCVLDLRPGKANDIDERYWELDSTSQGLFSLKGSFWREVSINSNPERARVFIDGEQVGFTPYNARLPAGEHKVEISREGFTSWEGELSTDEKKEINADLKKKVLFNAVDSRNTSKRLDADLTIDGSKVSGKTPREVTLTPGTHRITFSKSPDYETWSREINIVEQKNITARMKRGRYPVTVEVLDEQGGNPVPEASVLANGRKVGETGGNGRAQINISPQRQTLKISAPGYAAREITHDDPLSNDFVKVFLLREGEAEYGPQKPDPEAQNPADEPESPSPGTDENSVVILDTRPDLPGAEIYFNGEKVGETIRRLGDVPGGSHSVEIDHPYTGRVESSVNIEPGERVIVRFNSVGEAVIQ
ncbi:MAG: PEGA domain-containing protein, partial [Elusimicrobiota bacterium]